MMIVLAGCMKTTVVQSRYVIPVESSGPMCSYQWQQGDYWEFLAWAVLDDVSSSSALAVTAGYTPEELPAPGDEITIPIPEEYTDAVRTRMEAARMVRSATELKQTERTGCMELLRDAVETDPSWSVPVTNITVMLLEDGRTDDALEMLQPMSHKNTPALILAGIAWGQGKTEEALNHLAEALISSDPEPEVLAAAGIAWSITGEESKAGSVIRTLLEDPDAPSELRIMALRYVLMLGEQ